MNIKVLFVSFFILSTLNIYTAEQSNSHLAITRASGNSELLEMLHNAVINNSAEEIRKAVQAGASVDCGRDGKPALLWAILLKKSNAVEELLKCGANANITYLDQNLVDHAVKLGDLESASLVVKNGIDPKHNRMVISKYLQDRLRLAVSNDSPEQIRRAIVLGANIHDALVIFNAISLRKFNAVNELLKNHVNVNGVLLDQTPIQRAMEVADIPIATLLVNNGANFAVNIKNFNHTVIEHAFMLFCHGSYCTKEQFLELLQSFINHGYNVNSSHCSTNALYLALKHCWTATPANIETLLGFLISKGANSNQLIEVGTASWTPLFQALWIGDQEKQLAAIKILLNGGANINQQASPTFPNRPELNQSSPQKPLFLAIKMGQQETIDFLLKHGANL